jgi:hypothetical protein
MLVEQTGSYTPNPHGKSAVAESLRNRSLYEYRASLTKYDSLNQFQFRDTSLRYVFIRLRLRNTEVTAARDFNTTVRLAIER